jgi:predicted nucleotidyltransferase
MTTAHGLTDATIAEIRAVFARFPEIERALLYGSRAKGNYKPGSDIDLALEGDALTPGILGRIQNALEDGLLPYRFDLSIHADLTHAELLEHIRRVGVVLYEKSTVET